MSLNRPFFFRLVLLIAAVFVLWHLWIWGHIVLWRYTPPTSTAFMDDRLALMKQEDSDAALQHKWVPYEKISPNLKRAVIASEDAQFIHHNGFDWDGIQTAWEKNIKKGRLVAGGSTISQQLAKNLFLSSQRTPWRKAEEAIIAVMLESTLSKRRILEIYLNMIEWGDGVFGAEAAARHYYGISARSLSSQQAAKMAAMIPNPRFYDKNRKARGLSRKTAIIQKRMQQVAIPR